MKQLFILLLLALCPLGLHTQNKVGTAVTAHLDIFGNTTTTYKSY